MEVSVSSSSAGGLSAVSSALVGGAGPIEGRLLARDDFLSGPGALGGGRWSRQQGLLAEDRVVRLRFFDIADKRMSCARIRGDSPRILGPLLDSMCEFIRSRQ